MASKIITYCNQSEKLVYLKNTEKLFNCEVDHIVQKGPWSANIRKIEQLSKHLESKKSNYKDDDIVIFIDAFDVLLNSNHDEVIEKFKSYDCDILLGAELNFYGQKKYKETFDEVGPKNRKSNHRYINSGGYIGYVKYLKPFLKWVAEKGGERSDQKCFYKFFEKNRHEVGSKKINLKLDSYAKIFLNMHLVSWDDICFKKGRVYNKALKNNPCFIHFNGGTWQTDTKQNIMPIFVEKLRLSKDDPDTTYDLAKPYKYNQIVTRTCYPHPQK